MGKTESFEVFPTAELGEGKKERRTKTHVLGHHTSEGIYWELPHPLPTNHLCGTIQSKDLVIQSHISLLNCPCHLSHLEIELHTFPAQFPVCLKWAKLVRRYREGSAGTGFVEILPEWDFWRQQTSIWWSTGWGDGGGIPVASGRGWEKHGQSSIPHALERNIKLNPLLPLFCKDARHSPEGWRTVRWVEYLDQASFHFSG